MGGTVQQSGREGKGGRKERGGRVISRKIRTSHESRQVLPDIPAAILSSPHHTVQYWRE